MMADVVQKADPLDRSAHLDMFHLTQDLMAALFAFDVGDCSASLPALANARRPTASKSPCSSIPARMANPFRLPG